MDNELEAQNKDSGFQSNTRKRWLFRLVALAIFVFLTLVFCEVLLRVIQTDSYIRHGYRSGGLIVPFEPESSADCLAPEFRVRYQINEFGYRDVSHKKKDSRNKVLIFGDSFSEGWGVNFEDGYVPRLQKRLNDRAEFFNFAVNGGCQIQHIFQFREFKKLKPKVVVLQIFDNDILDNWSLRSRVWIGSDQQILDLPTSLRYQPPSALARIGSFFGELELRRKYKLFVRKVIQGKPIYGNYFVLPGARSGDEILSREQALEKFSKLDTVTTIGADTNTNVDFYLEDRFKKDNWAKRIQLTITILQQLTAEIQESGAKVIILYIPDRRVFLRKSAKLAQFNPFRKSISEFCKRRQLSFVDIQSQWLKDIDQGRSRYFIYDGHWNKNGHAAASEAIANELNKYLKPVTK